MTTPSTGGVAVLPFSLLVHVDSTTFYTLCICALTPSANHFAPGVGAAWFSGLSVSYCFGTWCHNPEDVLRNVRSSTSGKLESWFRIPLEAWMYVDRFFFCAVLWRLWPCDRLISRPRIPTKCPEMVSYNSESYSES